MIWLIGNKGMLGTELSLLLEESRLPFIGTDREVDITDIEFLRGFARNVAPAWVINCAAYTGVDKAEDEQENCRLLNAEGARNIAVAAAEAGAALIHISTDYVFNGRNTRPYTEDDITDPIGIYGLTKRDGEIAVIENNPRSYIIRTSWLYGKYGNNFVHTMLRLMNERDEIKVVNDQRGSPTWAFDLASTVMAFIKAVDAGKEAPFGIYHYTNEGNISWFDFAEEIYRQGREQGRIAKDCAVKPCTSAEYPAKVSRPQYSVLETAKIKSSLGIEIPFWDASLRKFLNA
jgi:dTDP-4-dehydrorhamnose reductase